MDGSANAGTGLKEIIRKEKDMRLLKERLGMDCINELLSFLGFRLIFRRLFDSRVEVFVIRRDVN